MSDDLLRRVEILESEQRDNRRYLDTKFATLENLITEVRVNLAGRPQCPAPGKCLDLDRRLSGFENGDNTRFKEMDQRIEKLGVQLDGLKGFRGQILGACALATVIIPIALHFLDLYFRK